MKTFLVNIARDEQGATAIEYGLIAALIAVAAITAMSNLGTTISGTFSNVRTKMQPGVTA
jgi:pilus assembly protein Flp/PilA